MQILLVEADPSLRRFLAATLAANGYGVEVAESVEAMLADEASSNVDLVLLGCPGWGPAEEAALGRVRQHVKGPVLVMAPRRSELDRRKILQAGAADFAVKPISPAEVLARMQSMLYRTSYFASADAVIVVGELVIDIIQQTVTIAGAEVALTEPEFRLLRALAMHVGQTLAPLPLCRLAFGAGYTQVLDSLPRMIHSLRQKLEAGHGRSGWIEAERGLGYRLQQAKRQAR